MAIKVVGSWWNPWEVNGLEAPKLQKLFDRSGLTKIKLVLVCDGLAFKNVTFLLIPSTQRWEYTAMRNLGRLVDELILNRSCAEMFIGYSS